MGGGGMGGHRPSPTYDKRIRDMNGEERRCGKEQKGGMSSKDVEVKRNDNKEGGDEEKDK